jgi:hypothetical protein
MRRFVVAGLAVLIAMEGKAVHADPAPSQVSPAHDAREDTRLLGELLRAAGAGAVTPRPVPAPGSQSRQYVPPADASDRLHRGVAAYRARYFVQSVNELVEASRLAPAWAEPYRWLAIAQADSDDCPSALINIGAFMARAPGDLAAPQLVALRDRCLHGGTLRVDSAPSGATIRVDDGPPIGTTSQRVTLRAGLHTITVEKPGFAPASRQIEIAPLGVHDASFALTIAQKRPRARSRWWWVAAGAVASAAVVGVALATTSGTDSGSGVPGVTCDLSGCHP